VPTYEYACKSCGKHLEVVQGFHDETLTTCPTCEGALRKVFGNIAISFKGTGFYSTDNRSAAKSGAGTKDGSSSDAPAAAAAKGDSGDSGSSSGGAKTDGAKTDGAKTETKSESKTETKKSESKAAAS
jgi:putative FmdB family regulatory protein